DRPTSGKVVVGGTDVGTLSEGALAKWRSQNVGFIFQFYNLIPVLTALENVELPLMLSHLSRKQRRERALTALKIVGLADRSEHYPKQLSGGQEQRVAIARAVVTDPKVLVADEPTGDLDAKSAEEILNLMQTLNHEFGKTIVMITHHNVSIIFNLPNSYLARIEAIPGVKRVTLANFFGGMRDVNKPRDFFPTLAIDADSFLAMYPEYLLTPDQKQRFMSDLRGSIVGKLTAEKFHWKEGDVIQLESIIPPYRIGKPFEFVISATFITDQARYP